jgi:hypothetical protein
MTTERGELHDTYCLQVQDLWPVMNILQQCVCVCVCSNNFYMARKLNHKIEFIHLCSAHNVCARERTSRKNALHGIVMAKCVSYFPSTTPLSLSVFLFSETRMASHYSRHCVLCSLSMRASERERAKGKEQIYGLWTHFLISLVN